MVFSLFRFDAFDSWVTLNSNQIQLLCVHNIHLSFLHLYHLNALIPCSILLISYSRKINKWHSRTHTLAFDHSVQITIVQQFRIWVLRKKSISCALCHFFFVPSFVFDLWTSQFLCHVSKCFFLIPFTSIAGFIFFNKSRIVQQTTLWILFAHHTIRSLPSESNGRHSTSHGLELRIHYIWRKQLRNQGESHPHTTHVFSSNTYLLVVLHIMRSLSSFAVSILLLCLVLLLMFFPCCTQVYKSEMYRIFIEKTFVTATENKWSNVWKMGHSQAHQFKDLLMLRASVIVRVKVTLMYNIYTYSYWY